MAKKIDRKLNGADTVEKELGDLLETGGTINGGVTFNSTTTQGESLAIDGRILEAKGEAICFKSPNCPSLFIHYNTNMKKPSILPSTNNEFILGTNESRFLDVYLTLHYVNGSVGATKLPNGFILQWGRFSGSFTNGQFAFDLAYPVAFHTSTPVTGANLLSSGGYPENEVIVQACYPNATQFTVTGKQVGTHAETGGNHAFELSWWAIGY